MAMRNDATRLCEEVVQSFALHTDAAILGAAAQYGGVGTLAETGDH